MIIIYGKELQKPLVRILHSNTHC